MVKIALEILGVNRRMTCLLVIMPINDHYYGLLCLLTLIDPIAGDQQCQLPIQLLLSLV